MLNFGLSPYISPVHATARIVWLLCILLCFCLAVYLSVRTVLNWLGSPTVITNVDFVLPQDHDFMPMVTVCPAAPSALLMFFRLAEKYKDSSQIMSRQNVDQH